jgi:hypothetical protein
VVLRANFYQGFAFATSLDEAGVQLLLDEDVEVVHGVVLSEKQTRCERCGSFRRSLSNRLIRSTDAFLWILNDAFEHLNER